MGIYVDIWVWWHYQDDRIRYKNIHSLIRKRSLRFKPSSFGGDPNQKICFILNRRTSESYPSRRSFFKGRGLNRFVDLVIEKSNVSIEKLNKMVAFEVSIFFFKVLRGHQVTYPYYVTLFLHFFITLLLPSVTARSTNNTAPLTKRSILKTPQNGSRSMGTFFNVLNNNF